MGQVGGLRRPGRRTAEAYRRRIRADYTALHGERKTIQTQLADLAADTTPAPAPDLVSLLPEVTADLASLPPGLQAELFEVFDIQIIWNAPMRQATFRATITDTTPAIVTALLTRAGDDPSHSTKAWPPDSPATSTDTSPAPLQGSLHIPIPIPGERCPDGGRRGGSVSAAGRLVTGSRRLTTARLGHLGLSPADLH